MLYLLFAIAAKSNLIKFGNCYISESRTCSFAMTNHSESNVRFVWPDLPHLRFVPRVGHLLAGCSKDFTLTLKVDKPLSLIENEVACRVCQIAFDRPLSEVPDWDDRQKTVKWVSTSRNASFVEGLVKIVSTEAVWLQD